MASANENDSGLGGIGDFGSGMGFGGFDFGRDMDDQSPTSLGFDLDTAKDIQDAVAAGRVGRGFFDSLAPGSLAEKAGRESGAEGIGGIKSAIQGFVDRFASIQKNKPASTQAAQTFLGAVAPPVTLGVAFTDVMRAAGAREESPTGPGPPPGPSRSADGFGSRGIGEGSAGDDGTNDSPDGSENQPTNFGQPTTSSLLTGATVTSPTADEIAAQEAEQAAFDAQAAADAEAFESARLEQVETARVAREKEAEETSRTRAEEAASNVRSNVRPQAASSDPIRLLAPNPDDNDDATTPQQRARFLTSGGPLGLTGSRANVRRPTLFGA